LVSAAVVPGGRGRASGPIRAVTGSRAQPIPHVDFGLRDPWPSNQHERC
jgi:hypothetical protein